MTSAASQDDMVKFVKRSRRVGAATILLSGLCGIVASSCGSSTAAPTKSAPSTLSPGTSTTEVTATTLARVQPLVGTSSWGPIASFGRIYRVEVVPVPAGQTAPPPALPLGTPPSSEVTISYRTFGSGPSLVLISGEHATMTTWDPALLLRLAAHYRVTVFDLPGVGYSGKPLGVPSVSSFADDTAGLLDALGLSQPTLLGWGLGGSIALSLAERHVGMVSALIIADSTAGGPKSYHPPASVAAVLGSSSVTNIEMASVMFPPADNRASNRWLLGVGEYGSDDILGQSTAMLALVAAKLFASTQLANGLSSIKVPTLVIYGLSDHVYSPGDSAQIVKGIHRSRALAISMAGYGAIFTSEHQIVDAIESLTS